MSNHHNGGRTGETEQMAQSQCLKVFIQRDYSEGTLVKFQNRFPQELEGRVSCTIRYFISFYFKVGVFSWNGKPSKPL